jgi:hypothetical protein
MTIETENCCYDVMSQWYIYIVMQVLCAHAAFSSTCVSAEKNQYY